MLRTRLHDIVLPHGGPQDCMPFSVKGLFEINGDIVQVLPVLEVPFHTEF